MIEGICTGIFYIADISINSILLRKYKSLLPFMAVTTATTAVILCWLFREKFTQQRSSSHHRHLPPAYILIH